MIRSIHLYSFFGEGEGLSCGREGVAVEGGGGSLLTGAEMPGKLGMTRSFLSFPNTTIPYH